LNLREGGGLGPVATDTLCFVVSPSDHENSEQ